MALRTLRPRVGATHDDRSSSGLPEVQESVLGSTSSGIMSITNPAIPASVEDIMKALLATPPPPAGHPSTRKKQPAKKTTKKGTKKR